MPMLRATVMLLRRRRSVRFLKRRQALMIRATMSTEESPMTSWIAVIFTCIHGLWWFRGFCRSAMARRARCTFDGNWVYRVEQAPGFVPCRKDVTFHTSFDGIAIHDIPGYRPPP